MPQRAYYHNFPSGVINSSPAEQIPDSAVKDALNMEFDQRSNLKVRPGLVRYQRNQNLARVDRNTFTNPPWAVVGGTVSVGLTGQDGPGTAVGEATIVNGLGTISNNSYFERSFVTTPGETYTFSIVVRPTPGTGFESIIAIEMDDGTNEAGIVFALHAQAADDKAAYAPILGSGISEPGDVYAEHIGDRWYRLYVTMPVTAASVTVRNRPAAAKYVGNSNTDPLAFGLETIDGVACTTLNINSQGFYPFPIPALSADNDVLLWDATFSRGRRGCVRTYGGNISSVDVDPLDYTEDRITSIYQYTDAGGIARLYYTSKESLWRYAAGPDRWDKTASFTPEDTNVQWVTYDGSAFFAVRGDGTNDAELWELPNASFGTLPVLVTDPVTTTAARPKPRYLELWNDRLWIVDDEEPNLVHCSKLGVGTNWSDTAARTGAATFEVGNQENEPITGLKAHNGKLFIFKRNRIYIVDASGSSGGAANQYIIDLTTMGTRLWSSELGCLSGYTILPVQDDLVFLSAYGLAALSASEVDGGLERSILSHNVEEFNRLNLEVETAYAVDDPLMSQYIIMFPTGTSTVNNQCWVMDYSGSTHSFVHGPGGGQAQSGPAFTRWNQGWHASCLTRIKESGKYRILIGGYPVPEDSGLARVYLFRDDVDVWADDCQPYLKRVITKAFTLGDSLIKKKFHRYHLRALMLTDNLDLEVSYRYDQDSSRSTRLVYRLVEGLRGGARFGLSQFANLLVGRETRFASPRPENRSLRQRIHGTKGRYGQSIQFWIFTSAPDQAFILKEISFAYTPSNERYIDEY